MPPKDEFVTPFPSVFPLPTYPLRNAKIPADDAANYGKGENKKEAHTGNKNYGVGGTSYVSLPPGQIIRRSLC